MVGQTVFDMELLFVLSFEARMDEGWDRLEFFQYDFSSLIYLSSSLLSLRFHFSLLWWFENSLRCVEVNQL